jgi:hypothetical protein
MSTSRKSKESPIASGVEQVVLSGRQTMQFTLLHVCRIEREARVSIWIRHGAAEGWVAWGHRRIVHAILLSHVDLSISEGLRSAAIILRHAVTLILVEAAVRALGRVQTDGGRHVAAALEL